MGEGEGDGEGDGDGEGLGVGSVTCEETGAGGRSRRKQKAVSKRQEAENKTRESCRQGCPRSRELRRTVGIDSC